MFRKALFGLVLGVWALQGQAEASPADMLPQQVIKCGAGNTQAPFTINVSETPRIYSQRLFLKSPGTFILTARAKGFTFEGHAYVRNNSTRKWELVAKSPQGRKSWVRKWRVTYLDEMPEIQMRMIKDNNDCKGCVITMNVSSVCQ